MPQRLLGPITTNSRSAGSQSRSPILVYALRNGKNFQSSKDRNLICATVSETETGFGIKADARSRSLRIRDLPDGTQEGLLQQTVEKLAPVNRVEVFVDKHEAIVEFQSQADAARLLLNPDPFEFNGIQLRFSEGEDASVKPRNTLAARGGAFIPRNAASRPRAGLGRARNPPPATLPAGSQMPSDDSAQSQGKGKAQDDFRKMLLGGK